MSDIKSLEHPTLKVPYETLNKKFRAAQKNLDREVSYVHGATNELERELLKMPPSVGTITNILEGVVEKLVSFKRKAEESINEELEAAQVCKRRTDHLRSHSSSNPTTVALFKKKRLCRMLVEYFLRAGYYNSAIKLVQQSDVGDLSNLDLFLVAREVEDSLQQKDTSKCLTWCYENKSKLRKMKSTLEFNLRQQEFIELIKKDQMMDAVKHARKYFSQVDDDQLPDVQHCMALLAFPAREGFSPYHHLLADSRWDQLVEQFRQENFRLYQLTQQSVFTVTLEAGLSALKTVHCYRSEESRNPDCPVCQKPLNELASTLPFAHCSRSQLVCHLTGKPLNEHNQPLMLPNGYVYGEEALLNMAKMNSGRVICPQTKEEFAFQDLKKVFIM